MKKNIENVLIEQWKIDEAHSFKGWDFSYLDNRWSHDKLPWDYRGIVLSYLKPNHQLLDMGTGGGEFLLTLQHPYHQTSVTEAWVPNLELCKKRLEPLGITVKQVIDNKGQNSELIPYNDNSFDIIINRHESYNIEEVNRVLKPQGVFITQQVGGQNNISLSKSIISDFQPLYPDLNLSNALNEVTEGLDVIYSNEAYPLVHFYDVGAIVYFAKIIQWEFPGFSVEKNREQLLSLQESLTKYGSIQSHEHRFIIVIQKIDKWFK